MSKKILSLLLCATMLFATGCSYLQNGVESLMQPPKLSQQQNDIYIALEAATEKQVKLEYPKKGDFTSAFSVYNIDNEPTEEAVVFFTRTNAPSMAFPLRMAVLDQIDGAWQVTDEVGVDAVDIEKVSFVQNGTILYIVVGFNLVNKSEKVAKIYNFDGGILNEAFSLECRDYEVYDLNNDSFQEIITMNYIDDRESMRKMRARFYTLADSGLEMQSNADMDPTVSEYVNIYKGVLPDGRPALYVDCLKGTSNLTTEILTMQNGRITNLIFSLLDAEDKVYQTLRQYGSVCADLDGDGIYEMPLSRVAPGYENEEVQKMYFTEWYVYDNNKLKVSKTTYVDYTLGYIFILPDEWRYRATIQQVKNEDEIIFYEYKYNNVFNQRLISIKVMQKTDYEKEKPLNGYSVLKEAGPFVYLYSYQRNVNEEVRISRSEIENSFKLIS